MATVPTIDFDAVFTEIADRLEAERERRLTPPLVRLWDGDMNLRGVCSQLNEASFQFVDNETGTGVIEIPADHYLGKWIIATHQRKKNVIITADQDGARWSGSIESFEFTKDSNGRKYVRVTFLSDYQHLKNIVVYSNPFLPPEIQFPRLWVIFGQARWCLKTTLFLNLLRLNTHAWTLPDNPMDLGGWFDLDQSNWTQVVKPDLTPDTSVGAIVHSRFATMHEVSRKTVADGQLSWEYRRYLDGDPQPWPGANLRHGTIVWDLVDKSGWNTGTSFGGSLFAGLVREFTSISGNGIDQSLETVDDPNIPGSYFASGVLGTDPSMPAVVFRDGEHTAVQESTFTHKPPGSVGILAGGSSMPGVNEGIRATIQAVGDALAMIPGVPPVGGIADALISPIFMDVFMAFGKHRNVQRANELGAFYYHERFQDGADKAYTLAWLLAMRTGMWETREINSVAVSLINGAPWRVGQNGLGHFFVGDRVGFALEAFAGRIIVERVSELTLSWSRSSPPTWEIQIGARQHTDPVVELFEKFQDIRGLLQALGVT